MRKLLATARPAATALVLAAALALPASAYDDGGSRSVFGYGAGNRALAMGGAFAGCADDASAMVWNPAGLGRVERTSLEAAYTGGLAMGFRESYSALALPSWRRGTLGIALRQFGVHGIEQRDDRNNLLSDNLTDSEMEVALGFARSFGSAWSLGASVKMQRQSLAGFQGSGFGADVGLLLRPAEALGSNAPWAHRLSAGVAVRNVVEPAIRLDQESASDPATVRAGLAYRIPLGAGWILAATDVEKTRGEGSRLHAGVELQPFNSAALRLGLDGRNLTAGAGLRIRDVAVDYAYKSNDLAQEHRVGVALSFGPTVEASRLEARRSEDEALQRLLAEEFRKRQAAQVAALLERAETARGAAAFDEALDALAVVSTLEPDNAGAAALAARCLSEKAAGLEHGGDFVAAAMAYDLALKASPEDTSAQAGAARCRAESDKRARRSNEIRTRFAEAIKAFASDSLPAARAGFARVLAADPKDADAATMLARTDQAITRRSSSLLEQAMRFLRSNMPGEAAPLLDQAALLDPAAPALRQAQAALGRARQQAEAARAAAQERESRSTPAAERAAPEAPRLSEAEVSDLYRHGVEAQKARRADEALRYMELVWSANPAYRGVGDYLKREYLTRGMESFAAGRLEDAVNLWEKVLRVDPGDARARGYLARAQQQMARSREIVGVNR